MKVTPLEIRNHSFRKSALGGYDKRDVESLKETWAEALENANREIMHLEEKSRDLEDRLSEHIENENLLKEAITTTHKMAGEIKDNARKEAELIVAEARVHADEIVKQAQSRAMDINEEIMRLKKQRAEFEISIKALLDYHTTKILMEEEEWRNADEEAQKIKFLPK